MQSNKVNQSKERNWAYDISSSMNLIKLRYILILQHNIMHLFRKIQKTKLLSELPLFKLHTVLILFKTVRHLQQPASQRGLTTNLPNALLNTNEQIPITHTLSLEHKTSSERREWYGKGKQPHDCNILKFVSLSNRVIQLNRKNVYQPTTWNYNKLD